MPSLQNSGLRVLCIYAQSQTYTQTVFEHVDAFRAYSRHEWFYLDLGQLSHPALDLNSFDAVVVHYSVRLPYSQICEKGIQALKAHAGLKALFIQDEYDNTNHVKTLIREIGFGLVLSVVPPRSLAYVYPPNEFPGVVFVSNLTGYVPDLSELPGSDVPPSQRNLIIGYRGRPLPVRYGQLGCEKIEIGRLVKKYCDARGISNDIAWSEKARIYGPRWYEFMVSCRAMLGSESGSNVFDWDGTLESKIRDFRRKHPFAGDARIYERVVAAHEQPGLMNQASPRLFEAIAARTALVLFEGDYSDVVTPELHYISLKKDGSNLDEVFALLRDGEYVDAMTRRAYEDVLGSRKYCYENFVQWVDDRIDEVRGSVETVVGARVAHIVSSEGLPLLKRPVRALAPQSPKFFRRVMSKIYQSLYPAWALIPEFHRRWLKSILKRILFKK